MDATRAGMGCGSCKGLVGELVEWLCGGDVEEDPSIHYYVPGDPADEAGAGQGDPRAGPEIGLRRVRGARRRRRGPGQQAGARLAADRRSGTSEYEDERDARFINDRVHANIQKDGTFSVIPEMPGGVTTPDELRRIADVADKYNVPLVKLTGGQRIDLVGVPKDDLPQVWQDLGMPAGYAWGKSYRTCKSCIGTDYCRFGLGDSMGLALKIERRFRGIDSPGKLKLATAGCPRNCSEALIKDVGAVAIGDGKWEIYVGGAGGSHVRKGDLLCVVDSDDDALLYCGRFMQYYRENAKYKERTYTFVERLGIERVRAVWSTTARAWRAARRGDAGGSRGRLRSLAGSRRAQDRQPVRVRHCRRRARDMTRDPDRRPCRANPGRRGADFCRRRDGASPCFARQPAKSSRRRPNARICKGRSPTD